METKNVQQPRWAAWFDGEHADLILTVRARQSSCDHGCDDEPSSKRRLAVKQREYRLHRVMVCSASPVFAAKFGALWSQEQADRGANPAAVMHHTFDCDHPDEMDAMDVVLRGMYEIPVQQGAHTGRELLNAFVLADRLLAAGTAAAIAASFARVVVDLELACEALRLGQTGEHRIMFNACMSAVIAEFNDTAAVISDPQRRARFVQLPFAAVLGWAKRPDLCVYSENCVAHLLQCWVSGPEGSTASRENLEALAECVQIGYMGCGFLTYVLPRMAWLASSPDVEAKRTKWMMKRMCSAQDSPDFGHRRRMHPDPAFQIAWTLDAAEVARLCDTDEPLRSPEPRYSNGYWWCLTAARRQRQRERGLGQGFTLGLYLTMCGSSSGNEGLGVGVGVFHMPASFTLSLGWLRAGAAQVQDFNGVVRFKEHSCGNDDFIGDGNHATLRVALAPYIGREGSLGVRCTCRSIDLI